MKPKDNTSDRPISDAIVACALAHAECSKYLRQWARLTNKEYEAMAVAVIASWTEAPTSFTQGMLDLEKP